MSVSGIKWIKGTTSFFLSHYSPLLSWASCSGNAIINFDVARLVCSNNVSTLLTVDYVMKRSIVQ